MHLCRHQRTKRRALDPQGRPNFGLLQNAGTNGAPVVFFAFDILSLAGRSVRLLPLAQRQQLLRDALHTSELVQLSESFTISAERMIAMVREHGLEDVIAKRLDSRYEAEKRSGSWQRMRVNLSQEFVVGGFTPGSDGFDSLVIGFYREAPPLTAAQRAALPKSRRQ